jgi:hypothetical protein
MALAIPRTGVRDPASDEREPRVSQYPPPYYQPPYGSNYAYPPRADDPRRPARRAALLMGVIGGLGLLLAGMMLVSGIVATPEMIAASPQAQQFQKMETQTGMTFRQMANMVAGFLAVPSLVFAAMALFVWRGGRGSVMTGLVFTACVTAFVFLQTLAGMAMGDPGAICFGVVLVGMLGWLCRWLWQARRAIPLVEAMRYARQAPAPAPSAWPAPPSQAHVPTYAPPQQVPVFGPATQSPGPGQAAGAGTAPLYAGVMQPPVPPPGYTPSSAAPSGRPVVYGYAQPPQEAPPAQNNPPAAGEPTVNASAPPPITQEADASNRST